MLFLLSILTIGFVSGVFAVVLISELSRITDMEVRDHVQRKYFIKKSWSCLVGFIITSVFSGMYFFTYQNISSNELISALAITAFLCMIAGVVGMIIPIQHLLRFRSIARSSRVG